jgi:hypothetical protein
VVWQLDFNYSDAHPAAPRPTGGVPERRAGEMRVIAPASAVRAFLLDADRFDNSS